MKRILFGVASLILIGLAVMALPAFTQAGAPTVDISADYRWSTDEPIQWQDTTKYKKAGPYKFGFSNCSTTNAYAVYFWETAKWEATKHPNKIAEFLTTDAGDSAAKQLSDVEDLIAKGIHALIIRPCTLDAAVPAIEKAMDKGIPVIISNRSTKTSKYVTQNTTPWFDRGRNQAEWVVKQLGGKGNIVSFEGPAGSGPAVEGFQGAMSVLKNNPNIKILARKATNWSRAEAKATMEDWLQAFPKKIDGILQQSGIMGAGVVEAIEEAKINPCSMPQSGDDYNGYMKWILKNKCNMITTNPTWASGASVVAALMILDGQPVPKQWNIPTKIYDATNIAEITDLSKSDEWMPNILPKDWKIGGK